MLAIPLYLFFGILSYPISMSVSYPCPAPVSMQHRFEQICNVHYKIAQINQNNIHLILSVLSTLMLFSN